MLEVKYLMQQLESAVTNNGMNTAALCSVVLILDPYNSIGDCKNHYSILLCI